MPISDIEQDDTLQKPPYKKFDKRIITHTWGNNNVSSNGYVISSGTYNRSVAFLNELATEAKADFPGLKDEDIEAFVVTHSSYNKGFAGVKFHLPENTVKEGYVLGDALNFSYA